MRKYGRIDSTHGEIVKALRKAGCFVQSLANIGDGCPDLLVIHGGLIHLLEVKRSDGPPSTRKLTQDELEWVNHAARHGVFVRVVESAEEALQAVGLYANPHKRIVARD